MRDRKDGPLPERGQVLWGANNVFRVLCEDGQERQCRLQGKILDSGGPDTHNPLTCGDWVQVIPSRCSPSGKSEEGLIQSRLPRRNVLQRHNLKRGQPQLLGANLDRVLIVVSWRDPKIKLGLLDRFLVAAAQTGAPVTILLNKVDLIQSWADYRLMRQTIRLYRRLGYQVLPLSLRWLGEGAFQILRREAPLLWKLYFLYLGKKYMQFRLKGLLKKFSGSLSIILGASGVGKSSLYNSFFPGRPLQEVREISAKWRKGVHTTTLARVLQAGRYRLIDTPGMRNFLPVYDASDLLYCYPDIRALVPLCMYENCGHVEEDGCAVQSALSFGLLAYSRYRSYLDLLEDVPKKQEASAEKSSRLFSKGRRRRGKREVDFSE